MGNDQAIQYLILKAKELSTEGRIFFALALQLPILLKLLLGLKKRRIVDEIIEYRLFWGILLLTWSLSFLVIEGIIIGSILLGLFLTLAAVFISVIFYFVIPKMSKSDISFESIEKEDTTYQDTALDFCRTGIQWHFDSILEGGIPRGQVVLVTGDYGTGKTIFGLEFLCNGANFYTEQGAFLSLDETLEDLDENTRAVGWNLRDLKKSIHVERLLPRNAGFFRSGLTAKIRSKNLEVSLDKILNRVLSLAHNKEFQFKRIVIDPFPCIGASKEKNEEIMRFYQMLNLVVKKYGLTCLIISHSQEKSTYWEIEPFLASTVFVLTKKQLNNGRVVRTIRIEKNRGTRAYPNEYVFEIRGKHDKPYKLKGIILNGKNEIEFKNEVPGIWVSATSFGTFGTTEVNTIEKY